MSMQIFLTDEYCDNSTIPCDRSHQITWLWDVKSLAIENYGVEKMRLIFMMMMF